MENEIGVKAEELLKREKYRERRGEEYDIVSKVAFLIGVPDSHWKSQYTGLDAAIYEQLNENRNCSLTGGGAKTKRGIFSIMTKSS